MKEYNNMANLYGYTVQDDGAIIITANGKNTQAIVKIKGKRLSIVTTCNRTLFTGANKPTALESFIKSYWYASKI